jgi:hypothetical protein
MYALQVDASALMCGETMSVAIFGALFKLLADPLLLLLLLLHLQVVAGVAAAGTVHMEAAGAAVAGDAS